MGKLLLGDGSRPSVATELGTAPSSSTPLTGNRRGSTARTLDRQLPPASITANSNALITSQSDVLHSSIHQTKNPTKNMVAIHHAHPMQPADPTELTDVLALTRLTLLHSVRLRLRNFPPFRPVALGDVESRPARAAVTACGMGACPVWWLHYSQGLEPPQGPSLPKSHLQVRPLARPAVYRRCIRGQRRVEESPGTQGRVDQGP